jgi:hypothetical protein
MARKLQNFWSVIAVWTYTEMIPKNALCTPLGSWNVGRGATRPGPARHWCAFGKT